MPTQVNWRFCQLCKAMLYDGLPSKFVCTVRHSASTSGTARD
jgi:hypothetical protein